MSSTIRVYSKEGETIDIDQQIAFRSGYIKHKIEDEGDDEDIHFNNIKSATLHKVIEFCTYYNENELTPIPKPIPSSQIEEFVTEWDAAYIDLE